MSRPIVAELELASHDLDKLIGRMRAGGRTAPSHDDVEEEVQEIAGRMLISVRGPGAVKIGSAA